MMGFFRLDAGSIADRVSGSGMPAHLPTLAESLLRGVLGFAIVSMAGFLPWVLAGRWFYRNPGELTLYSSCAAVIIVLSGLLLHRLIIGPGSLPRFYLLFGVAFAAYAGAWVAGWVGLRGQNMHVRSVVGLFAAAVVMGLVFSLAFANWRALPPVVAALFVLNAAGYFGGGWIEGCLARREALRLAVVTLKGPALGVFMKLAWGACYGVGLGAGLGCAFYLC